MIRPTSGNKRTRTIDTLSPPGQVVLPRAFGDRSVVSPPTVFTIVALAWWASAHWHALTGDAASRSSLASVSPIFLGLAVLRAIAISIYLLAPR